MRKWFWCGAGAALLVGIGVYCTAGTTAGVALDCFGLRIGQAVVHQAFALHQDAQGVVEEDEVCAPEDPQVVEDCCPVQNQQADGPMLPEPIDLLAPPPLPPMSGPCNWSDWVLEGRASASLAKYQDEREQLQTKMTRSQDAEEQENGTPVEKTDSKETSEQLRKLLVPQPLDGSHAGQRKVDTLDFRPSDAKPGQFDRIPF
jgi:hypothetical protein